MIFASRGTYPACTAPGSLSGPQTSMCAIEITAAWLLVSFVASVYELVGLKSTRGVRSGSTLANPSLLLLGFRRVRVDLDHHGARDGRGHIDLREGFGHPAFHVDGCAHFGERLGDG